MIQDAPTGLGQEGFPFSSVARALDTIQQLRFESQDREWSTLGAIETGPMPILGFKPVAGLRVQHSTDWAKGVTLQAEANGSILYHTLLQTY